MIVGKVGKVVVAQEELEYLFKAPSKEQKKPSQNQSQKEQQKNSINQPILSTSSIIRKNPVQHVKIRYTNPLKPSINQDLTTDKQLIKLYNSVTTPNLANFSKLFHECENVKRDYSGLILEEPLDKEALINQGSRQMSRELSQKSQGFIKQKSGIEEKLVLDEDSFKTESPLNNKDAPKDLKTLFREEKINRFVGMFKCPRETAIWYLEAFGDFKQACQQYLENQ